MAGARGKYRINQPQCAVSHVVVSMGDEQLLLGTQRRQRTEKDDGLGEAPLDKQRVTRANEIFVDAFYTDVRRNLAAWRESRGLPARLLRRRESGVVPILTATGFTKLAWILKSLRQIETERLG
jgi:hypothetical protein